MTAAEFDKFSGDYENVLDTPSLTTLGGASSRDFIELKCRELIRSLKASGLDPSTLTAVDAGCGTGIAEEFLHSYFNKMIGVDLSSGMVEEARRKGIAGCEFLTADASAIPLADESVQVVFSFCIFHHADPTQLSNLALEARRLLSGGGTFAIFEHNPWNPLTRYIVKRCPVDANVTLLPAPLLRNLAQNSFFQDVITRYLIFFPRFLKPLLPLEKYLSWLPLGGQYMIIARKF